MTKLSNILGKPKEKGTKTLSSKLLKMSFMKGSSNSSKTSSTPSSSSNIVQKHNERLFTHDQNVGPSKNIINALIRESGEIRELSNGFDVSNNNIPFKGYSYFIGKNKQLTFK